MLSSIDKYIKKISNSKSKSFSDDLLNNLDIFLNDSNSKLKIDRNQLIIKCDDDELQITLGKHGNISYEMKKDDISVKGQYHVCKNGYFVKLIDEQRSVHEVDNIYYKDIARKEVFKVLDRRGVEQFRRVTFKLDNYYEDKKTGEITLYEPDIMENYTKNSYMWRVNGKYVLKRNVKKYIYPDGTPSFIDINNSDDCYIGYQLIDSNDKELPNYGEFYGIDKEVFFNYFQKKSNINDVVDNFHSKKYKISHAIEI